MLLSTKSLAVLYLLIYETIALPTGTHLLENTSSQFLWAASDAHRQHFGGQAAATLHSREAPAAPVLKPVPISSPSSSGSRVATSADQSSRHPACTHLELVNVYFVANDAARDKITGGNHVRSMFNTTAWSEEALETTNHTITPLALCITDVNGTRTAHLLMERGLGRDIWLIIVQAFKQIKGKLWVKTPHGTVMLPKGEVPMVGTTAPAPIPPVAGAPAPVVPAPVNPAPIAQGATSAMGSDIVISQAGTGSTANTAISITENNYNFISEVNGDTITQPAAEHVAQGVTQHLESTGRQPAQITAQPPGTMPEPLRETSRGDIVRQQRAYHDSSQPSSEGSPPAPSDKGTPPFTAKGGPSTPGKDGLPPPEHDHAPQSGKDESQRIEHEKQTAAEKAKVDTEERNQNAKINDKSKQDLKAVEESTSQQLENADKDLQNAKQNADLEESTSKQAAAQEKASTDQYADEEVAKGKKSEESRAREKQQSTQRKTESSRARRSKRARRIVYMISRLQSRRQRKQASKNAKAGTERVTKSPGRGSVQEKPPTPEQPGSPEEPGSPERNGKGKGKVPNEPPGRPGTPERPPDPQTPGSPEGPAKPNDPARPPPPGQNINGEGPAPRPDARPPGNAGSSSNPAPPEGRPAAPPGSHNNGAPGTSSPMQPEAPPPGAKSPGDVKPPSEPPKSNPWPKRPVGVHSDKPPEKVPGGVKAAPEIGPNEVPSGSAPVRNPIRSKWQHRPGAGSAVIYRGTDSGGLERSKRAQRGIDLNERLSKTNEILRSPATNDHAKATADRTSLLTQKQQLAEDVKETGQKGQSLLKRQQDHSKVTMDRMSKAGADFKNFTPKEMAAFKDVMAEFSSGPEGPGSGSTPPGTPRTGMTLPGTPGSESPPGTPGFGSKTPVSLEPEVRPPTVPNSPPETPGSATGGTPGGRGQSSSWSSQGAAPRPPARVPPSNAGPARNHFELADRTFRRVSRWEVDSFPRLMAPLQPAQYNVGQLEANGHYIPDRAGHQHVNQADIGSNTMGDEHGGLAQEDGASDARPKTPEGKPATSPKPDTTPGKAPGTSPKAPKVAKPGLKPGSFKSPSAALNNLKMVMPAGRASAVALMTGEFMMGFAVQVAFGFIVEWSLDKMSGGQMSKDQKEGAAGMMAAFQGGHVDMKGFWKSYLKFEFAPLKAMAMGIGKIWKTEFKAVKWAWGHLKKGLKKLGHGIKKLWGKLTGKHDEKRDTGSEVSQEDMARELQELLVKAAAGFFPEISVEHVKREYIPII
ncbi:hypothetical protein B0A48_14191 [Cryoendolithus antarcticus]|uniref:Uncharacterized protein n=1 Tax=Cryoendolithus antarcticus TaxID=1507870 RepID=A0A1V8SLE3_9PEZI|nr:hypothetical protein B0A48_14191 [Cryoendolithus antarcticus]